MGLKHIFTSGKAAAADPTLVDGPNWDDEHVVAGGNNDQVFTRDSTVPTIGWKWAWPVIRETTGAGTTLTPGAIADGQLLVRSGTAVIGDSHKADQAAGVHGSAVAATAGKLVHRDAAGRAQMVDPSAAADIATKSYADGKVAKTGDTMTGALALPGNPTGALQAVPKQYVDALPGLQWSSHYESLGTTTAARFLVLLGLGGTPLLTEGEVQLLVVSAGTLKTFAIYLTTNPGGGANSRTFTVRLNGVATGLTLTFTGTEQGLKTVSVDVAVAAGDFLAVYSAGNGIINDSRVLLALLMK